MASKRTAQATPLAEDGAYWDVLFETLESGPRVGSITWASGRRLLLDRSVPLGVAPAQVEPFSLWCIGPPGDRTQRMTPASHGRMVRAGAVFEPVHLSWEGKKVSRALVLGGNSDTGWRREDERLFPFLRVSDGVVERHYAEGGWEVWGCLHEPAGQPASVVHAEAVRLAIGFGLRSLEFKDASSVSLHDLAVEPSREPGAFDISFTARGQPHNPPRLEGRVMEPMAWDATVTVTWREADGDPRAWLLAQASRLEMGRRLSDYYY